MIVLVIRVVNEYNCNHCAMQVPCRRVNQAQINESAEDAFQVSLPGKLGKQYQVLKQDNESEQDAPESNSRMPLPAGSLRPQVEDCPYGRREEPGDKMGDSSGGKENRPEAELKGEGQGALPAQGDQRKPKTPPGLEGHQNTMEPKDPEVPQGPEEIEYKQQGREEGEERAGVQKFFNCPI